ncbi:hypothetical protein [Mesorhizobium sp. M0030]|uniref:hypothetical protein n=1 Tax=Mesorhizobium sp. M0030 TaxID=2956851 RepID=UPI003338E692
MNADNPPTSGSVIEFKRLPNGTFAPGSGGRVRGSRNRVSKEAVEAVHSMRDLAIAQLRSKLEAGDSDALFFVLERIVGKGRSLDGLDASPEGVREALSDGTVTTSEAKDVATMLARLADVEAVEKLRADIEELRQMVERGNGPFSR